MSTWNDIAVTYWHQVCTQSETATSSGADQGWQTGLHMRRGISMEGKHQSQRHVMPSRLYFDMELLAHIPEWLARKAGVLGCTSSNTILFMCWKEIFPNEDETRFDLVDELYTLPAKMPTSMFQFAAWLEDWISKLVVADEVSAHIEPKRAMAILNYVCG